MMLASCFASCFASQIILDIAILYDIPKLFDKNQSLQTQINNMHHKFSKRLRESELKIEKMQ